MIKTHTLRRVFRRGVRINDARGFTTGEDIDINGTSRVGRLRATEEELISLFGESNPPSGDGKVCSNWSIKFNDGTVAHIHDYKGCASPWSIGGNGVEAVNALLALGLDAKVDS
jgi:hypothetical protein